MMVVHFEILVEELSAEVFLSACLPSLLKGNVSFSIHAHQGKHDLLRKLESRLKGYARWLPDNFRIVVLVDRDDEDCRALKARMEGLAAKAGLATGTLSGLHPWRVVNRIAVEELEAWYFGAWKSVRRAYPGLSPNAANKAALRQCDEIAGGTWEAFERLMQKSGYAIGGLRKVEAADAIGKVFDPDDCRSPSFIAFRKAILGAMGEGEPS